MNGPPPGIPGQQAIRGYAPGEVQRWAYKRLPHERETFPQEGERLLFRERDFGPAVPCLVYDLMDLTGPPHNHWHRHGGQEHLYGPGEPDPNVWEPDLDETGRMTGRWHLKEDPWPWVHIQVIRQDEDGTVMLDEKGKYVLDAPRWCREARVRGSAGWLREGSRAHTGIYEETRG